MADDKESVNVTRGKIGRCRLWIFVIDEINRGHRIQRSDQIPAFCGVVVVDKPDGYVAHQPGSEDGNDGQTPENGDHNAGEPQKRRIRCGAGFLHKSALKVGKKRRHNRGKR